MYLFIFFILLKHSDGFEKLQQLRLSSRYQKKCARRAIEMQIEDLPGATFALLLHKMVRTHSLDRLVASPYILYIILVNNVCLISVQKKTELKGGNRVRTGEISQFCSVIFHWSGQRLALLYKHNLFLRFKLILLTSQILPTNLRKLQTLHQPLGPDSGTMAAYGHCINGLFMVPTSHKYTLSDEYLSHCCDTLC